MKKYFTLIATIVFLFSAVAYGYPKGNKKNKKKKNENNSVGGMEDDAADRTKWEVQRLADPATGKIPDYVRQKELAFASTLPNDAYVKSARMPSANFVNRGPWNVGGRTNAFAIDVTNENRLIAGSPSGGMFLSTDGGVSWNSTNTNSQLKGAVSLAQDKRLGHTNNWYYGGGDLWNSAGDGNNAYFLGDGIYKSINQGVSWLPLASTAGLNPNVFNGGWQCVYTIVTDQSAPDSTEEVYAAVYGNIYRSINGGTSWSAVRTGGSYITDVAITTSGVVYATLSSDGTQKGIWRSTTGVAGSYTQIIPPTIGTSYHRIALGINPNNEDEVYFLGDTPGNGKVSYDFLGTAHWSSLWKYTYVSGSGDGVGGTWQDLSINLPVSGGMFDKFQTQGSYDIVVKVKPGNSNVVFVGGTNLYRSTSGFQDSTNTSFIGGYEQYSALPVINSYPNHHPDQHGLEFLPSNPDVMISTNDGGMFKTLDNNANPVVWQSLNNGYVTSMFYTVAIDHGSQNNDIICGGAQDNGTWFTNSNVQTSPWKFVSGGDGEYCAIADNQSSYYFSAQNLLRLLKVNLDANGNSLGYRRIDPIGAKGYIWSNPFVLDPNDNNIMYLGGGKNLWRNSNLSTIPLTNEWDSISTNWMKIDSIPTASTTDKITCIRPCKTPANRVYVGTGVKNVYKIENADTGIPTLVNISPVTGSVLFPSAGYVSCIAVDPNDGNKVMVVFSNYNIYSLFYTADGGTTWTKAGGNLEGSSVISPSIRWASILPVSDGVVYLVATSTGLYATDSINGTATVWVQQGTTTIGNSVCDMIDTRPSDGLVVIATHANGMYSANITSVHDVTTATDLVNKSSDSDFLLSNYPNPVSGLTTIEFTLKKSAKINLQLLDECGRVIETLVNEGMQAGKHSVIFDKKNLASGIYYYSLLADKERKTNKMVILK